MDKIQIHSEDLWEKVETSTNRIITQNYEAALKYEETLEKLEKINETIFYIWDVTNKMRSEIDKKLGWITEYIGSTGTDIFSFKYFSSCLNFCAMNTFFFF